MPMDIQVAGSVPARHLLERGKRRREEFPLLVIDAEVANTRED